MNQRSYRFSLFISADEYLKVYANGARHVVARASNGQRVQFPANLLRAYVTRNGVSGQFELTTDENNRVANFRKLG